MGIQERIEQKAKESFSKDLEKFITSVSDAYEAVYNIAKVLSSLDKVSKNNIELTIEKINQQKQRISAVYVEIEKKIGFNDDENETHKTMLNLERRKLEVAIKEVNSMIDHYNLTNGPSEGFLLNITSIAGLNH
jgi:hypothetical protein